MCVEESIIERPGKVRENDVTQVLYNTTAVRDGS